MVVVREVSAKNIFDSRKEKTIFISIKTNVGKFFASSPTGKSVGKYENPSYKKSLENDIDTTKKFKDYFSADRIDDFYDLRRVEDIVEGHLGANTLFALESAILKALAKEKKKEIWQLINPNAKKFPRLVGNCIGGGKHSVTLNKKPDFQEFLIIPKTNNVKKGFEIIIKAKKEAYYFLKDKDKRFEGKKNDEDAWATNLNDKEVLEIIKNFNLPIGVDVAASGFHKRNKYYYQNPKISRNSEEQFFYISNLINNFNLFYIEDPFNEDDFELFSKLLKKFPDRLIVGDDLIVTNIKRFKRAIEQKCINAVIIKPNQCGSLLEVSEVCDLAKKNGIKIIFSHRSGETNETILSDLAFGFGADFFKCGITGKEREAKIKRLIEIEKNFR
ncbi:MAG: enolase C-terminal domain-like protein [Candidatus Pacearchaeota archaeon]